MVSTHPSFWLSRTLCCMMCKVWRKWLWEENFHPPNPECPLAHFINPCVTWHCLCRTLFFYLFLIRLGQSDLILISCKQKHFENFPWFKLLIIINYCGRWLKRLSTDNFINSVLMVLAPLVFAVLDFVILNSNNKEV